MTHLAFAWGPRPLPWTLVEGGRPSERWLHMMRAVLRGG